MLNKFHKVLAAALLPLPVLSWAQCNSDVHGEAVLSARPSGGECTAPVMIKVQAGAAVNGNQTLKLLAPVIALKKGFRVEKGGQLHAGQNYAEIARFLNQATFGPTQAAIDHLLNLGSYDAWLEEQFALPLRRQLPAVRDLDSRMCSDREENYTDTNNTYARRQIWWQRVLNDQDQLRQRVAFALSQILVVSDIGALGAYQYGMTDYWDTLMEHAFGNYRDLLEAVTLHPMMGEWLSSIRNRKAVPEENIHPDENYAREILQLFSIGLHQLNIDGSLKRDGNGIPLPTYGQNEVREFARVFTGLIYDGVGDKWWRDPWNGANTTKPMVPFEEFHDTGAKTLLDGKTIPAGGDTLSDIDRALDIIFNHPNVGPFISKQLIQRLVTSNPKPAYVERVARVFNDNGSGVRGDLQAVVRAILLDPEARFSHPPSDHFGKLREPLLRFSHLWRAFGIDSKTRQGALWTGETCGQGSYQLYEFWWGLDGFQRQVGQDILGAPSVFNFYQPGFVPPGPLAAAGRVGPEFQIATESWLTGIASAMNWQVAADWGRDEWSVLNLSAEAVWGENPQRLLDRLNLLLLDGRMSAQERDLLLAHLGGFPYASWYDDPVQADIVRDAIMLIVNSPNYLIQQ